MLSDIIKHAGGSDTKALATIFSCKKIFRQINGGEERYKNYLVDLVSESSGYQDNTVTLLREIIPNDVICPTQVIQARCNNTGLLTDQ